VFLIPPDDATYTANEQFFADCLEIHNTEIEYEDDVVDDDDDLEEEESNELLCFPISKSLSLQNANITQV
jgi:hypothetical protein